MNRHIFLFSFDALMFSQIVNLTDFLFISVFYLLSFTNNSICCSVNLLSHNHIFFLFLIFFLRKKALISCSTIVIFSSLTGIFKNNHYILLFSFQVPLHTHGRERHHFFLLLRISQFSLNIKAWMIALIHLVISESSC